jgi:predicted ABC-type ATPase
MNTFTFIVGPVAAGKTTFMENKLYNFYTNECNFFDDDKSKLMIQLYANDNSKFNDINLSLALKNAINDSINNHKDFMMQIHFTTEQLSQVNSYLYEYGNKFDFNAHFIAVSEVEILRERANKRELLGGHSSQGKSIDKSFKQSFKNFITYLPKFTKATIWDNTKEFGFNTMEQQLVFEKGNLIFKNSNLTDYAQTLLDSIENNGLPKK